MASGATPPAFPEPEIAAYLDVIWADPGRSIFNNWLGLIYRLTNVQRGVPFMPTVNSDDPLGLGSARK